MVTQVLDAGWTLAVKGDNIFHVDDPVKTQVPSTVYGTLLAAGLMPDPFYRDNELQALKLMDSDFEYRTKFTVRPEIRKADRIFLRFNGIDTLSDIYLDGVHLGSSGNMNRVYEFDITDAAGDGKEHELTVALHSPTRFIHMANEKTPIGGSSDAMPGFPHLRKAGCMFGWDWGPRLPDAGLFRNVEIVGITTARLSDVRIRQIHHVTGRAVHGNVVDRVEMICGLSCEWMPEAGEKAVRPVLSVTGPDGQVVETHGKCVRRGRRTTLSENLTCLTEPLQKDAAELKVDIDNPQLWWPNGYGKQPLYNVKVTLQSEDNGQTLDTWEKRIGLRTVTVNTDAKPDEQWDPHMTGQKPDLDDGQNKILPEGGQTVAVIQKDAGKVEPRNFAFEVNGLQIFAMGGDYIPEDSILTRQTRARTGLLLSSAAEAHYNCIRVWGGGYFCDDFLYDLCDEKGILVWQDFMFGCAAYELTAEFEENITLEIRQNMRRLRSHPCIALWCGNNENETQFETWEWPKTKKQFYDYIRMYEYIIPKIVREEDPDAFYWPSSPSSGGNFENSNAENTGDTHYWGVWHGGEPFTAYRSHHYRFLSEFGFQSFPCLDTVRRFTKPEDRNIFSRIMEMHQRNTAANGKIMNYLSQTYLYPKDFDSLLYCSQLLQADAIRYGVEHFRRFRGTCMGTVVWQLNDIWPVASWSSIDYYGNWKALHYAEKRMFAPVLLSCCEHGEVDQKPYPNTLPVPVDISADLHVANETDRSVTGTVNWSLRRPDSSVVREGSFPVTVPAFGGAWLPHLDFNGEDPLDVHLGFELVVDGKVISRGSTLFCAPKHYHFLDPELTVSRKGDVITVHAENFAKAVSVEIEGGVLRLDDNFVDLEAGEAIFHVLPGRDFTDPGQKFETNTLRVRSLYDTVEHAEQFEVNTYKQKDK